MSISSVNAHAEELRERFVAHEGKKELVVYASGTRYTVDFGDMARQMTSLIDENVSSPLTSSTNILTMGEGRGQRAEGLDPSQLYDNKAQRYCRVLGAHDGYFESVCDPHSAGPDGREINSKSLVRLGTLITSLRWTVVSLQLR
jgi:Domain of unknown function (DUF4419)